MSLQEADTGGYHRQEPPPDDGYTKSTTGQKEDPILVTNSSKESKNNNENEDTPRESPGSSSRVNGKLLYSEAASQSLPTLTPDDYKLKSKSFQDNLYKRTKYQVKTSTNIDSNNRWNKIFVLTTKSSFTLDDINLIQRNASIELKNTFESLKIHEIDTSLEIYRNPDNTSMTNKEEDIKKTNTTPFVYGDVVYWKVFIDPSFIENEEVSKTISNIFLNSSKSFSNISIEQYNAKSNKKFAMLKVTFPGQFRTHYIREAAQHAFAKYGKLVDQSTFYAELNFIKDFTMAKKPPTFHYILLELNSNSLPPPKDHVSFTKDDQIISTAFYTHVSLSEAYCTACSTIGHRANKCPLNSKCTNCHRKGHCYITCKSMEIDHKIDTFKTLPTDAQERFIHIRESKGKVPFYLRKDFDRENFVPETNPNTRDRKRSKAKADYPDIEKRYTQHSASNPSSKKEGLTNDNKQHKLISIHDNSMEEKNKENMETPTIKQLSDTKDNGPEYAKSDEYKENKGENSLSYIHTVNDANYYPTNHHYSGKSGDDNEDYLYDNDNNTNDAYNKAEYNNVNYMNDETDIIMETTQRDEEMQEDFIANSTEILRDINYD